jgi:hypothetical protein
MDHLKSYKDKLNEEVLDIDQGLNLTAGFDQLLDFSKKSDPKDPRVQKLLEIAKKGELYRYMVSGQRELTFGMLKALHRDALEFKRNREIKQGIQKALWRLVPIALAPVAFPIWIVAQILGVTRSFNKVISQVLKISSENYQGFIFNIINKTMDIAEGEIERLTVDDWFYRSFAVEKGLIDMVRKEHIIDFSYWIAKRMEYQDDLRVVPQYYIENEFRKWLNRKFRLDPQLPLKKPKPRKRPRNVPKDLEPSPKRKLLF